MLGYASTLATAVYSSILGFPGCVCRFSELAGGESFSLLCTHLTRTPAWLSRIPGLCTFSVPADISPLPLSPSSFLLTCRLPQLSSRHLQDSTVASVFADNSGRQAVCTG